MTTRIKIGRRGQMTLPRIVRDWLDVGEGDHIAFVRCGSEIVVRPLTHTLLDLRGAVKVHGPQDLEAVRQAVKQRHAKDVVGDDD